jgi:hypothetical protein
MDWIWSSRCLKLLCTSTQSSNLKWVSGGGINSPRHPKSRWLTATEKVASDEPMLSFSKVSVHPMPSTSLSHWRSTDTIAPTHYTDGASVHSVLKDASPKRLCMLLRDCRIDWRYLWPWASVHPVLKRLSWHVSVSIQTKRRIDRRCPHLDRRIIRCYCLCCSSSATRPTLLENGPSVHSTVPRVSPSVDACYLGVVGSSDGISFLPFLRVFNLDLYFNLTYVIYLTCHYL